MARRIKLTVDVTQDDIDQGVRKNCKDCPVARATLRALQQSIPDLIPTVAIQVMTDQIRIHEGYDSNGYFGHRKDLMKMHGSGDEWMRAKKDEVKAFIHAFDRSAKKYNPTPIPQPFTFTLEFVLPDWAIKGVA